MPKLRFPEFRGTEGWEAVPLGSLLDGRPEYGVNAPAVPFAHSLPRYLRITDISDDGRYLDYKPVSVEVIPSQANSLSEGDIVLARTGASVGKSYRYRRQDGEFVFAGFLIRVRPDKNFLHTDFFANFLQADEYRAWVVATSARSGQPGINGVEYATLPVPLPASHAEQLKIAECLSSVDDLIAAQARKVDALKTHKKGLMQQLFPREGETQPRLRFTEFRRQGDWELRRLEELAKRGSGHTPSKSKPEYYNGGVKWISLSDSRRLDRGLITDTSIEISQQGIANSSAVIHAKGTVLISRDAGIGKIAVMGLPMAVSQHFIVWTCDSRLLSNWFLYYLLQYSKPIFERAATGSTIKTIGLQFFIDLSFQIPSLPEQQRIAACLSSLDDLIMAEGQKLEVLKTHKRGLMQQLFPSVEAPVEAA